MTFVSPADPSRSAVLVVSGYGIRLSIDRGHLRIEDGIADERRELRISRVDAPNRIVVLGNTGMITLEALRWLRDVGTTFIQVDPDGNLVTVGASQSVNDIRIRRAQALAMFLPQGMEAARYLLTTKVKGQRDTLGKVSRAADARAFLNSALSEMATVGSLPDLRHLEARAAATYWDALRDIPVRFIPRDADSVPAHWQTIGTRRSPLTESARKAVTPAHALFNYVYAVLEAEARIASLAVGCDPGMGIVHTDNGHRDSFALDLMEAVRPAADAYVIHLLTTRTFVRGDFFETREGVCRLMPPFAEAIAQTGREWARLLAPVAEHTATLLRTGMGNLAIPEPLNVVSSARRSRRLKGVSAPFRTPLTGRNRSRTRNDKQSSDVGVSAALVLPLPKRCKECGVEVTARRRMLCDDCLATMPARASLKAQAVLRQLREVGEDRRSADDVCEKRRRATARSMRERAEWEAKNPNPPGPEIFRKEILPKLTVCSLTSIVEATGLSRVMCSNIRRGVKNPHPRHWEALRKLSRGVKSM